MTALRGHREINYIEKVSAQVEQVRDDWVGGILVVTTAYNSYKLPLELDRTFNA